MPTDIERKVQSNGGRMLLKSFTHLYHGTPNDFDMIDLRFAKPFKDYGSGYYLTTNLSQAQKWGQYKGRKKCYVYVYKVNVEAVPKLKVLELLKYDKKWVDVITNSRILGKYPDYDIVYDRIADNKYADISDILLKYQNSEVSYNEVVETLKWRNDEGDQVCFRTNDSLKCLTLIEKFCQIKDNKGKWKIQGGLNDKK